MAKVRIERGSRKALGKAMRSDALAEQLEAIAAPILSAAATDPNPEYVDSLRMRRFLTDRVAIQVGAHPVIGPRVEAKRGTLARAMARAGL